MQKMQSFTDIRWHMCALCILLHQYRVRTYKILICGDTGQNLGVVEGLYRERFPHRRHPCANTILRVVQLAHCSSVMRVQ